MVTIPFIPNDLTLDSLIAKLTRPEIIKAQAKLRKAWNGEKNEAPAKTMTAVIGNDERNTDPLAAFKALIAKKRGCKVSEVSDADAETAKELLEGLL